MFQSRYRAASHFRLKEEVLQGYQSCFNLVIERLLISGRHLLPRECFRLAVVSISLSSGFSFQVCPCVSVPIGEHHQFQSRYRAASHFRNRDDAANGRRLAPVSISLSSGFSFQEAAADSLSNAISNCFNLVIERLLISGNLKGLRVYHLRCEFQSRYRAASHFRMECPRPNSAIISIVSISLSSGFSFQVARMKRTLTGVRYRFNLVIERLLISGSFMVEAYMEKLMFQSRYRAASHFRHSCVYLVGKDG